MHSFSACSYFLSFSCFPLMRASAGCSGMLQHSRVPAGQTSRKIKKQQKSLFKDLCRLVNASANHCLLFRKDRCVPTVRQCILSGNFIQSPLCLSIGRLPPYFSVRRPIAIRSIYPFIAPDRTAPSEHIIHSFVPSVNFFVFLIVFFFLRMYDSNNCVFHYTKGACQNVLQFIFSGK